MSSSRRNRTMSMSSVEAVLALSLMLGLALALAPRPSQGLGSIREGFEDEIARRLLEGELARARRAHALGKLEPGQQQPLSPERWASAEQLPALELARTVTRRAAGQGFGAGLEVVVEGRWRTRAAGPGAGGERTARLAARLPWRALVVRPLVKLVGVLLVLLALAAALNPPAVLALEEGNRLAWALTSVGVGLTLIAIWSFLLPLNGPAGRVLHALAWTSQPWAGVLQLEQQAIFLRSLGTSLAAGCSLRDALLNTQQALGGRTLAGAVEVLARHAAEGASLVTILSQAPFLDRTTELVAIQSARRPDAARELIALGELHQRRLEQQADQAAPLLLGLADLGIGLAIMGFWLWNRAQLDFSLF